MDAHNQTAHTLTPTPKPTEEERLRESYNLYENEDGSDVILMVGDEMFRERIPAHSWVLAASNQFFNAMFHKIWADTHKKTYNIRSDPKGFQNLLKWLYRREFYIQSTESALTTLHVAIQYLCPELADLCADYITQHLNEANVLRVLQDIYRYCPQPYPPTPYSGDGLPAVPSAPTLEELEGDMPPPYRHDPKRQKLEQSQDAQHNLAQLQDFGEEADLRDPTACCNDLYNECLEIIDRNTSAVLASEALEELDAGAFEVILRRQTLSVRSEEEVLAAVVRWSTAQCKRQNLPLKQPSMRKVLGGLIYHLRLLTLTREQLKTASRLLSASEMEFLTTRASGRSGRGVQPPPTLAPYVEMMAIVRGPLAPSASPLQPSPTSGKKKKCSNKRKYTRKEFILDVVACLAMIFD